MGHALALFLRLADCYRLYPADSLLLPSSLTGRGKHQPATHLAFKRGLGVVASLTLHGDRL